MASAQQSVVRDLTAFQQNILTVLAEEARYGLAVKRELEDYYGEEINHGRLYPNLDDLADKGLVEKSELDLRTNQYSLTAAGERGVQDLVGWQLDRLLSTDERATRIREIIDADREVDA